MLAWKIACLKSGQWLLGCHPARKASQPEHQNTRRKPARRKPDAKTSQPDKRTRVILRDCVSFQDTKNAQAFRPAGLVTSGLLDCLRGKLQNLAAHQDNTLASFLF